MTNHTELQNKDLAIEDLCQANVKVPDWQKTQSSKKWDCNTFDGYVIVHIMAEMWLIWDDCGDKFINNSILSLWTCGGQ